MTSDDYDTARVAPTIHSLMSDDRKDPQQKVGSDGGGDPHQGGTASSELNLATWPQAHFDVRSPEPPSEILPTRSPGMLTGRGYRLGRCQLRIPKAIANALKAARSRSPNLAALMTALASASRTFLYSSGSAGAGSK